MPAPATTAPAATTMGRQAHRQGRLQLLRLRPRPHLLPARCSPQRQQVQQHLRLHPQRLQHMALPQQHLPQAVQLQMGLRLGWPARLQHLQLVARMCLQSTVHRVAVLPLA